MDRMMFMKSVQLFKEQEGGDFHVPTKLKLWSNYNTENSWAFLQIRIQLESEAKITELFFFTFFPQSMMGAISNEANIFPKKNGSYHCRQVKIRVLTHSKVLPRVITAQWAFIDLFSFSR